MTPTISAAAGSNTAQTGYVFPPTAATVNQVLCTSSVFLVKGYYRISRNLEGYLDLGLCLYVNLEFLFQIEVLGLSEDGPGATIFDFPEGIQD